MRRSSLFIPVILLATAAAAAPPRPPGWSAGGQGGDRAQEMVDRLKDMVDRAERRRAADPLFLDDLRALVQRYDRPWRVEVLYDDFGDGDYTRAPAWTVAAGRFAVEWGRGLRSVVTRPAPAAAEPGEPKVTPENLPALFLRGLLQPQPQKPRSPAPPPARAEIHIPLKLSNAFALRIELSSRAASGELAFGPYQRADRADGYRLAYYPGGTPRFELLRRTRRGTQVVDSAAQGPSFEDDRTHVIEWTRARDGSMVVEVDGRRLFSVADRGFNDPFRGFVLVNRGGDFGLHRILILATKSPATK